MDPSDFFSPTASVQSTPESRLIESFGLFSEGASLFPTSSTDSLASTPASTPATPAIEEKKPTKKRKSWGQELPIPTTNLPPRKRAKTEAEKEQRRVERVLRNRAAAQSSRERKRVEVEALEEERNELMRTNEELKVRLAAIESQRDMFLEQFNVMRAEMDALRQTMSKAPTPTSTPAPAFTTEAVQPKVIEPASENVKEGSNVSVTQHPAAVLCDQQCPQTAPYSSLAASMASPISTPSSKSILSSTERSVPRTSLILNQLQRSQPTRHPSTSPPTFSLRSRVMFSSPKIADALARPMADARSLSKVKGSMARHQSEKGLRGRQDQIRRNVALYSLSLLNSSELDIVRRRYEAELKRRRGPSSQRR